MPNLKEHREKINTTLRLLIQPFEPSVLYDAMTYYLFQDGKRIRPLLVQSVCEAWNGSLEDALILGCAIEIVHNYSLIHDDLPCMDNDAIRRGKPTCHVVYGEDLALLAGDALLTLAFEILSDKEYLKGLSPLEKLLAINILAKKAGFLGMIGGQVMDIRKLGFQEEVNTKKTAELFSASFMFGAISAHKLEMLEDVEQVGKKFGLIFQMVDDYKDKDGMYKLIGENLRKVIQDELKKLREHLKNLGLMTQTFEEILGLLVC